MSDGSSPSSPPLKNDKKIMDLGQAVKTLRQKQNLTQVQLAERCGMSTNAICSLETGKSYPPKATVERLCEALGLPTAYFLMATIEENDFPEEKRVLYRALLEPLRKELLSDNSKVSDQGLGEG